MPKVYLILLNWNGWSDTVRCLESIFHQTYPNYRVIVCDNASQDGSPDHIRAWAEGQRIAYQVCTLDRSSIDLPLLLINTGANLGFAGGNNIGIQFALAQGADYVWLLNNDAIVEPEALTHMVTLAEQNTTLGMVGSPILRYHQPDQLQCLAGGRIQLPWGWTVQVGADLRVATIPQVPVALDFISGCSVLVRRQLITAVGMMDDRYFLYWEDVDWSVRAHRAGWELGYASEARIWHREGSTIGRGSPLQDYYAVRNGLLFMRIHYPHLLGFALLYQVFRTLLPKLVRGQFQRLGMALRGYGDFVRGRTGPYP